MRIILSIAIATAAMLVIAATQPADSPEQDYAWTDNPTPWYTGNLAYILHHSKLTTDQAAGVLDTYYNAVHAAAEDYPDLPVEEVVAAFVRIARYESHWRVGARGAAGELGTLQTWPGHRPSMSKQGLDINSEYDRCLFWARKVAARLSSGESFWKCFSPWSVVNGAYPVKARQIKDSHAQFMTATRRLIDEMEAAE